MKRRLSIMLLAGMIASSMVLASCGRNTPDAKPAETTEKTRVFTEEDLKDVVDGIDDHYILQDAKNIDYTYGITYNEDIVKDVRANAKEVKISEKGTYSIIYTVTVDTEKLEEHLKDSDEMEGQKDSTSETGAASDQKESKEEESKEPAKEETEESEKETEITDESAEDEVQEDLKEEEKEETAETEDDDSKEDTDAPDDGMETEIEIEKEITIVDKEEADELVEKNEEVWTDDNKVIAPKDEDKTEEPEKEDTKKEDVKKEDSKKEDTKTEASKPGVSSGSDQSSSKPSEGTSSQTPQQSKPSQPSKPAHTHSWVAHYTTKTEQTGQQWISNLVQVGSKTVCNGCGADITGNIEHTLEEKCSYHSEPVYEDQGWYEPVYSQVQVIDYYYCSCGAKK